MSHHTKYTEKEWLDMIRDCKSSGLSDQEWCREHHIVRSTFYKHLKRFHTAADDDGGRLPVKNLPLVPEEHEILPLIITEEPSCEAPVAGGHPDRQHVIPSFVPAVRIIAGNMTFEISNDASPSLVAETLRSLRLS